MIEQIEETVASEHGLEPDEPDSAREIGRAHV